MYENVMLKPINLFTNLLKKIVRQKNECTISKNTAELLKAQKYRIKVVCLKQNA